MTRPTWVPDGPQSDRARWTTCRRCQAPVLHALAEGVAHLKVDPVQLSPLAEITHLLTGGTTLRLWPDDGALRHLAFRDPSHIRAHPGRGLPLHDCARNHGPPDPTVLGQRPTRNTNPTDCPF